MAFYICKKCGHTQKTPDNKRSKTFNCPKCKKQENKVHANLVEGIKDIIHHYTTAPIKFNTAFTDKQEDYQTISTWFQQHNIEITTDKNCNDSQSLFAQVGLIIGEQYDLLNRVVQQIKFSNNKGWHNTKYNVKKSSQKEIATVTQFCSQLKRLTFVASYHYNKNNHAIHLRLLETASIKKFFNGDWFEWFVFMTVKNFFAKKKINVACLHNVELTLANEDHHELDVFLLIDNRIPICIECKSGEFANDINKYQKISKIMNLDERQFMICSPNIRDHDADALRGLHHLTFSSHAGLVNCLENLLEDMYIPVGTE